MIFLIKCFLISKYHSQIWEYSKLKSLSISTYQEIWGLLASQTTFSFRKIRACVASGFVDMVDSNRITAGLTTHQMSKYYSLFINWVSGIISGYSVKVVKTTGDGL